MTGESWITIVSHCVAYSIGDIYYRKEGFLCQERSPYTGAWHEMGMLFVATRRVKASVWAHWMSQTGQQFLPEGCLKKILCSRGWGVVREQGANWKVWGAATRAWGASTVEKNAVPVFISAWLKIEAEQVTSWRFPFPDSDRLSAKLAFDAIIILIGGLYVVCICCVKSETSGRYFYCIWLRIS